MLTSQPRHFPELRHRQYRNIPGVRLYAQVPVICHEHDFPLYRYWLVGCEKIISSHITKFYPKHKEPSQCYRRSMAGMTDTFALGFPALLRSKIGLRISSHHFQKKLKANVFRRSSAHFLRAPNRLFHA